MIGKNATCPGSGCSTEMPSKRYSFVRGRPPLMRGSSELGGSATPGSERRQRDEAAAVERQLDDLLVVDDLPEAGRLRCGGCGASAVDGHLSLTLPTASSKSTRTFSPVATCTPSALDRLEPGQLDVDAVHAGRQARATRLAPSPVDTVARPSWSRPRSP